MGRVRLVPNLVTCILNLNFRFTLLSICYCFWLMEAMKPRKEIILLWISVFICLATVAESQNLTYLDTSGFSMDRSYLERREVHLESVDLQTGLYFACSADSVNEAGTSFLTLNINNGDISQASKDDTVLIPPVWSFAGNIHLIPLQGTPYSDCSFAGISRAPNGTELIFAVMGQSSSSETVWINYLTELPNQDNMFATVVWSDLGLITIAWGGGSNLTSYITNNDFFQLGPFSYLAQNSSTKATVQRTRWVNNKRFWVILGITSGYTLIYKCNSTNCELSARVDGTNDFYMNARENDQWWGCGKQSIGYFCTSYLNTSARVYLPQNFVDDNPPVTSFHSTCLLKDSMLLFLSPTRNNYTLIAMNVQNNFDIVTVATHIANADFYAITCLEQAVIVPTRDGFDFWKYEQPDTLPIPPAAPVAPIAPPIDVVVPTNDSPVSQPVVVPQAELGPPVASPTIDVPLTAGLTTSLVGAALAVGIFLLIFLLKKNKKKQQGLSGGDPQPNDATYGDIEMNTQNSVHYVATPGQIDTTTYALIPIKPEEIDAKMLIPYNEIQIEKEIGAGSYGKVYLGKWRGANVAIKSNTRKADAEAFLAEARLTAALPPHPNVVLTYGISIDSDVPYIVLEYCDSGSLDNLVFSKTFSVKDQQALVKGLAYGLYHLHRHNIVHRDLAARNVLVHQGVPKISDFGMSRILKEAAQGQTNSNVGPIRWMAPECIKSMTYSTKSDVWAFGILISEIVNGEEPHLGTNQIEIAIKIRDEGFTPSIENCDPTLAEVMRMCWKKDPNERPTMAELCEFINQKM